MKVKCSVGDIELVGEHSDQIPSICVTCDRCDHQVEVFGQSMRSVRRGLIMLREECPMGEGNFYVAEEEERAE
jgi:hypothetical protein